MQKYADQDFYNVCTTATGKVIVPQYYYYEADGPDETPCRRVGYRTMEIRLRFDIESMEEFRQMVDIEEESCTQYVDELSQDEYDCEMNRVLATATPLLMSDVTEETSDGFYVDMEDDEHTFT